MQGKESKFTTPIFDSSVVALTYILLLDKQVDSGQVVTSVLGDDL